MDSVSSLLQEARPLYLKNKQERRLCIRYGFATVLAVMLFTPAIIGLHNNQNQVDALYAKLYTYSQSESQTAYYIDEFDVLGVI